MKAREPVEEVLMVAIRDRVHTGRGMIVNKGDSFWAKPPRAAELIVVEGAMMKSLDDLDEMKAVNVAYSKDRRLELLVDARVERIIRQAWEQGLLPESC